MSEFTRGPWTVNNDLTIRSRDFVNSNQMGDYQGRIIADLKPALGADEDYLLGQRTGRIHALAETLANAHLIAAAPDMYEALSKVEYFLHELRSNHGIDGWSGEQQVIDALRKARGEVPTSG